MVEPLPIPGDARTRELAILVEAIPRLWKSRDRAEVVRTLVDAVRPRLGFDRAWYLVTELPGRRDLETDGAETGQTPPAPALGVGSPAHQDPLVDQCMERGGPFSIRALHAPPPLRGVLENLGVAEFDFEERRVHCLIERADSALYRAKKGGGNRTERFQIDAQSA